MRKEVDLSHFLFDCLAGRKIKSMHLLKISKANLYHSVKERRSIKSIIVYRVEAAAALILLTVLCGDVVAGVLKSKTVYQTQ